jgi:hypothetical protein
MKNHSVSEAMGGRVFSYPGLVRRFDRYLDALATAGDGELASIQRSIALASRQIEFDIARRGLLPQQLTGATRAFRGWVALLSDPKQFEAYQTARAALVPMLEVSASARCRRPFLIHFRPMPGLYTLRTAGHGSTLSLPTAMIGLPEEALRALTQQLFHRTPAAKRCLFGAMLEPAYQALQGHIEKLGGVMDESVGEFHNLGASFERVNAEFFEERMPRPHLAWSRTLTGRKFGHYNFLRDSIIISRTLDDAAIPLFLIDYILYHELLHKHHGLQWTDSTARAHTAEFYRDERKFPRYDEADELLRSLAMRMPSGGKGRSRFRSRRRAPASAAAIARGGKSR